MTLPDQADQRKVFRIETKELRALVGANEGRLGQASFNDLTNQLLQIEEQARNIATTKKEAQLRTGYDKDLMHLYESLILYHRLKNTLQTGEYSRFYRGTGKISRNADRSASSPEEKSGRGSATRELGDENPRVLFQTVTRN